MIRRKGPIGGLQPLSEQQRDLLRRQKAPSPEEIIAQREVASLKKYRNSKTESFIVCVGNKAYFSFE